MLVILFATVFCAAYLRSTSKWWYEDDPAQFSNVGAIANPLSIFADPSVVRHFGTGASLVPMQMLSYWFDVHLAGPSPRAAYLHSLLSIVVTTLLVYVVLARLTADRAGSAAVAVLWLCLPSTIAVHYFLSTRHYVEGFGWSLAAGYLAIRACERPTIRISELALFSLCAVAAVLSKEIYAAVLPVFVFLYAAGRRRGAWIAAALVLGLAYAVYRLAILGPSVAYPARPSTATEYLRYLGILPYTFSAHRDGYVFYGLCLAGVVWLLLRKRASAVHDLPLPAALLGAALLAMYPTAGAVLLTYAWPGTWYRAVFIIHTISILSAGYLLIRHASPPVRWIASGLVALLLVPGVRNTRMYWEDRFARSEIEGRFYLSHPDKLVYSEEDAAWYLPGLERLYGVARSHYVNKGDGANSHTQAMLHSFATIWRYREGEWVADDGLYARLREQMAARAR